jgi:regulator of protease activity HflC (stomatin/prohibitin superfamily)
MPPDTDLRFDPDFGKGGPKMIVWLGISGSLVDLIHQIPWGWAVAILLAFVLVGWLIYRKEHIVVSETQVAVVYNTDTHGFSRFLAPGRHRLNTGVEQVRATISTAPREAKSCCEARTRDGIPVMLEWQLTYRLEPLNIDPHQSVDEVRSMVNKAESKTIFHTCDCIRELLVHYSLEELWVVGIQNRVKRQLTRLAAERLHPYGVEIEWIEIENIQIPPEFQAKRLAQLVRAVRVNRGDLSKAEIGQLTRLNTSNLPEPVRDAEVLHPHSGSSSLPGDHIRSPENDYQDSLVQVPIQDMDIPGDSSIGKIVI